MLNLNFNLKLKEKLTLLDKADKIHRVWITLCCLKLTKIFLQKSGPIRSSPDQVSSFTDQRRISDLTRSWVH